MYLQNELSVFILLTILGVSVCLPTGAPISACQSMMPAHPGVLPQSTPSPYMFKIGTSSFQNGKPIKVEILGPTYSGLLLTARTFNSTDLLGSWLQPPNNTKILPCPENPTGAITHSNTNIKTQSTMYTWMPPDSNCPPVIFFRATVAQSFAMYWLDVQSTAIWKDSDATCGNAANTWRNTFFAVVCFELAILLLL
ncbi:putative defense protein Hdd11-like [Bombina bombina]|uniref:putative defense protein Hdd11-like n=1 Tax=Bombina bombina TaxID=8345 RepID=UPI00235A62BE|nr:putative defense protein Hdd11-like [Bombina bombina]